MPTVKYSVSAYTADGTTTDYLITWDYLDDDHITVEVDGVSNDDPTANHTFVKLNDTTVRVTDGIGGAIAAGSEIQIRRNTPITTRPISFADGSALLASDLNKNSDYLLYAMQEALDEVDFTVQYQEEAEGFKDETEALRDQTATYLATVQADATDADNHRIAAALSETNAAASETAAATSETNAATSETNAATSETNAATSAAAALASQNAAATSETNAATSETNAAASAAAAAGSEAGVAADAATATAKAAAAATSETNAANSATSAANSASASQTSATASAASASAAATSATNAAASESAAATSEGSAATYATNSQNSATAAATSETNAATSATNAATSATNASTSETNAANSATSASTSATNAAASYDAFDDRYLGAKASDPTTDNDGDALITGALYFNTTDDVMKVYEGTAWAAAYASLSGALLQNNNLSDVADAASARTNLGLGTGDSPSFAGLDVTGTVTSANATLDVGGRINFSDRGNLTHNASNYDMTFNTNSLANALVIKGTGNVGIGTTSPANLLELDAGSGSNAGMTIRMGTGNSGANDSFIGFENSAGTEIIRTRYDNPLTSYVISSDTSGDVLSVTRSGKVGIGTTSPAETLHVKGSGNAMARLQSGTSSARTQVQGVDNLGNDNYVIGSNDNTNTEFWNYKNGYMRFATNSAERMRLDNNGNLFVGKTGFGNNSAGHQIEASGLLRSVRANSEPALFNRTSSDGDIVTIKKDDSLVGSIGSTSGQLNLKSAGSNLNIYIQGSQKVRMDGSRIYPQTNNAYDVGYTTQRFKDGFFAGTIYAANFDSTSDATLKTNVETIPNALDKVQQLRGVSFDWIESGKSEVGVIAQEVEAVIPELVSTDDQGIKSVKYGNIVSVLIEAIKEQQQRIVALEAKLGE